MKAIPSVTSSDVTGFTLLEMSLTLGILSLLVGGMFALADGSIQLMDRVEELDRTELARSRFTQLCHHSFEQLPSSGSLLLTGISDDLGGGTALSFVDSPLAFNFGGNEIEVEQVVLAALPDGGGNLRVRAYYLDQERLLQYEGGAKLQQLDAPQITLLRDVQRLQWRFFDSRDQSWKPQWDDPLRRPGFVELRLQVPPQKAPHRVVFWVPKRRPTPTFQTQDPVGEGDQESNENAGEESNG